MYVFEVRLADADRAVFEVLTIRAARHPSETAEYLLTRLIAYCLEYSEGIAFSKGLSDPDEPAIAERDLTGAMQAWIEVGVPEASRLHQAAKAAPTVAVYSHRGLDQLAADSPASGFIAPRRSGCTQSIRNCLRGWSRALTGA